MTKATNIIMVPTRTRFLITPPLSAWHYGPKIGFSSGKGEGGAGVGGGEWGGGAGTHAPNRLFMKGVRLSLSLFLSLLFLFSFLQIYSV